MEDSFDKIPKEYQNPYGRWEVTTEGDVEGKTIKHLGIFEGYVDEIAFHLADECCYSLKFKKLEKLDKYRIKKKKVNISFHIGSKTWELNHQTIGKIFKDCPVAVSDCNYYAAFTLTTTKEVEKDIKEKALEKLTEEEKEILGLK